MKLIRCHKCGTVVISEESFLQNILDAMDEACRRARRAKSRSERTALLQEASEYKAMYRSFMHHLTERDRAAHNESSFIVSEIHKHLRSGGTVTADNFQSLCDKGKARAAAIKQQEDKELTRIYGAFDSICNRTMPSPTERAAMKHLR